MLSKYFNSFRAGLAEACSISPILSGFLTNLPDMSTCKDESAEVLVAQQLIAKLFLLSRCESSDVQRLFKFEVEGTSTRQFRFPTLCIFWRIDREGECVTFWLEEKDAKGYGYGRPTKEFAKLAEAHGWQEYGQWQVGDKIPIPTIDAPLAKAVMSPADLVARKERKNPDSILLRFAEEK